MKFYYFSSIGREQSVTAPKSRTFERPVLLRKAAGRVLGINGKSSAKAAAGDLADYFRYDSITGHRPGYLTERRLSDFLYGRIRPLPDCRNSWQQSTGCPRARRRSRLLVRLTSRKPTNQLKYPIAAFGNASGCLMS